MPLPSVSVSQTPEEKFREFLTSRAKAQRYTDQQRDLVRFIFEKHNHFDAEQLVDDLKAGGLKISRATIYRTLTKLVEAGMLRRLEVGLRTYYEHDYGYPQHDHLVCESCNKIIEFQNPQLEAVVAAVCAAESFQHASHSLLIRGTCLECNKARSNKRKLDLI
ncbi:transcriptional repressor [Telmatocola sphagniphila]|uniref:Ferric uptake regulation protein n=1 Tax=Telmatocola sphagniphila TaxID=1123043 RepID=A0A8E6EV55_9BACT|nr:Fur family transcriptional regulator [Telmatocola sphagniphila]QVL34519.1 transcriptional repressor [Telmatocola sphagniphila]